jgi:hypothetical protein
LTGIKDNFLERDLSLVLMNRVESEEDELRSLIILTSEDEFPLIGVLNQSDDLIMGDNPRSFPINERGNRVILGLRLLNRGVHFSRTNGHNFEVVGPAHNQIAIVVDQVNLYIDDENSEEESL